MADFDSHSLEISHRDSASVKFGVVVFPRQL